MFNYTKEVIINDPATIIAGTAENGLGEGVEINGVYVSSESEEMLTPAVTRGVITKSQYHARLAKARETERKLLANKI